MRVVGPNRTQNVGKGAGARKTSSGSSFTLDMGEEVAANRPLAASASAEAVGGIDALLALQGVDDPLVGRRKAIKRGHDLLDTLEGLRADLLAGRVSGERLERILMLVSKKTDSGDPKLDALIEDIDLRARVELAKLGRYPS